MTGWAGKRRSDRNLAPRARRRHLRMRQKTRLYLSSLRKKTPARWAVGKGQSGQTLVPRSTPKKSYNSSTSTPKHQRKTRHLHQDCNICSKFTNTSGIYTAGFWNISIDSTKTECCTMLVINKGPNKRLLFDPNKGSNLEHPVGFSFWPEFLPPQIFGYCPRRKSTTRWLHHTVGFSFFTTTTFKDLVYGQSSSHWQRLRVSSYRGFFLFYYEPHQPQRINKVGVSFQTTPTGTITYTHSPRTGVDSSTTYSRVRIFASSPKTGTRTKCLQTFETLGVWLSQWNLTTRDAFKMQWVFSFLPRQTNKYHLV